MNFKHISIAAALALTGLAANAAVVGSLGALGGSFAALSAANTTGTLQDAGVSITNVETSPVAAVGKYLVATVGSAASFTPLASTFMVSFDWGTPDAGNLLTVNTATGSTTFTAAQLGLLSEGYVTLTSTSAITSLGFTSSNIAFETANFATAVPEPSNIALMLGGIGLFGFMARKRRV
jgi:hypothetical protein